MDLKNMINWDKLHSINKRTSNGLMVGEINELTSTQKEKINNILARMDTLSIELYNEFEIARNLFKNSRK